jgi:hypothetical protein
VHLSCWLVHLLGHGSSRLWHSHSCWRWYSNCWGWHRGNLGRNRHGNSLRGLQCGKSSSCISSILFKCHGGNSSYFVVVSCAIRSHVTGGANATWLGSAFIYFLHPPIGHLESLTPLKLLHFLRSTICVLLDFPCFPPLLWLVTISRLSDRFGDLVYQLQPVFCELGQHRLSPQSSKLSHSSTD